MSKRKTILVTREEIARAGGVRAAVEEALSLAALQMTPRAMTAYEATGMTPTDEDGAGVFIKVEVENEEELREAVAAGADGIGIVIVGVGADGERLKEVARALIKRKRA